jgi:hypothetical protein
MHPGLRTGTQSGFRLLDDCARWCSGIGGSYALSCGEAVRCRRPLAFNDFTWDMRTAGGILSLNLAAMSAGMAWLFGRNLH